MELWDRAQQPDRIGMLRVSEERRDLATLDNFAASLSVCASTGVPPSTTPIRCWRKSSARS